MFTLGHFVWLFIIFLLVIFALLLTKRVNFNVKKVEFVVVILLILLKVVHLAVSMKELPDGGMVLHQTQLSFHLCSIMIYSVIAAYFIKNEQLKSVLKSFMVPCMVIGALLALLIPTEGVDPSTLRVWQYMLIHGVLVYYGFYLMIIEKVDLSLKVYFRNLALLVIITLLAMFMNSVLEQYGTNFLFLRQPPMPNLPILNLNNGWYIYFISLMTIAVILIGIVHLPFIINKSRKQRK